MKAFGRVIGLGNKGLWAGLFAAAILLVLLPRLFKRTPAPAVVVRAKNAIETVLGAGRVVGEKTFPLSFVRPGRIAGEFVEDGDRVSADTLLMQLDSRREELALSQARTALAEAELRKEKLRTVDIADAEEKLRQARAGADYAAGVFKRQTELYGQKAITALQYEQGRRDMDLAASAVAAAENQVRSLKDVQAAQADLQIDRAKGDLRRAELDLSETRLTAPLPGRIVSHDAHKGEFVQAGQKILTFIPDTVLTYVEILADETEAGRIKQGQKAAVSSPAFPGRIFSGSVERLGAIVDNQRGSFAVRIALERFESDLLPESTVNVQIMIGEAAAALLLEQRFIFREGGAAFVFIAERGRAKKIPVEVRDLGNGLFECRRGLRDGSEVLLPSGLKDGLKVKPVPATE